MCPGGLEDRPGCSGYGPRAPRVRPKCLDNHSQLEHAFARYRSPFRVVHGLGAVPCISGSGRASRRSPSRDVPDAPSGRGRVAFGADGVALWSRNFKVGLDRGSGARCFFSTSSRVVKSRGL